MEDLNHWHQYRHKSYNSIIIGAGITGLSMAMWLKLKNPKEKILICDKGMDMASRRNAGFVTSGSLKYLLNLIDKIGKKEALAIWRISKKNRELIEDFIIQNNIAKLTQYQKLGSVTYLNQRDTLRIEELGFKRLENKLLDGLSGVIDTEESSFNPVRFHDFLLNYVIGLGVEIDFNSEVTSINYKNKSWIVSAREELKCKKLFIATNCLILIDKTIEKDKIVRTRAQIQSFHLSSKQEDSSNIYVPDKKIYYRIHKNKLIIGGLRIIDRECEVTNAIGLNPKIQDALEDYVLTNIDNMAKIENQWSGIMGMRNSELPLVFLDKKKSLYFLGGYSGHGNAFAFYLSKKLIESVTSGNISDCLKFFF